MRIGTVHLSFGIGSGILLATVVGAAPAAWAGMDFAWMVVSLGLSVLILSPWLARRQVLAISEFHPPPEIVVHAGRTIELPTRVITRYGCKLVMVALSLRTDSQQAAERAPRLLISAMGCRRDGHVLGLLLRAPARGRSPGLRVHMTSSYPFGLVRASRQLESPVQVTALPRLIPERDLDTRRVVRHIVAQGSEALQRHIGRGQGLPVSLREARIGDSVRDLHIRSSLRRGRWTAIERPRLANDCAGVTVCYPTPSRTVNSRRSHAAFEAAISVAASIAQRWTSLGLEVELSAGLPTEGPSGHLEHDICPLRTSKNPLTLLHALTDLTLEAPPEARRPQRRAHSAPMALGARIIPVESLLHRPAHTRVAGQGQLTVWADPHGRTILDSGGPLQQGRSRSAQAVPTSKAGHL